MESEDFLRSEKKRDDEEPIGIAKRNIAKGERVEVFICSSGQMFSEAIDFFNKTEE